MKYQNPLTGQMHELDPQNPQPGIYAGVPSRVYHTINAVSRSALFRFSKAPEYWAFEKPKEPTDSMVFGTQYHAFVLTSDIFDKEYLQGEVTASGSRGAAFKAAVEKYGKEYVYRPVDLETFMAMKDASLRYVKQHRTMFYGKWKEIVVIALHESTGLMLKILMDFPEFESGYIVDLKTTAKYGALETKFHYKCKDLGYYLQCGFYPLVCSLLPELRHMQHFRFIVQETEDPFIIRTHDMKEHISEQMVESERLLGEMHAWIRAGKQCNDEANVMRNYSL